MIPTFESSPKLGETLRSVLGQDLGSERMQIAVVDDASKKTDVARIIRSIDPDGRVEYLQNSERLGLCGNWNRAIQESKGELVHLLHQDDYVQPGFYKKMDLAFRSAPSIGMAFCRSRIIDGENRFLKTSSRERWRAGLLDSWIMRISERQRIQTPSVVVARKTYEAIGGYLPELSFALDWEMWVRIAARYSVWYEPTALAVYRRHRESETSRLESLGQTWTDLLRAIEVNAMRLPSHLREELLLNSYRWHGHSAVRSAYRLFDQGNLDGALSTLEKAKSFFKMIPSDRRRDVAFRRLRSLKLQLHRIQPNRKAA